MSSRAAFAALISLAGCRGTSAHDSGTTRPANDGELPVAPGIDASPAAAGSASNTNSELDNYSANQEAQLREVLSNTSFDLQELQSAINPSNPDEWKAVDWDRSSVVDVFGQFLLQAESVVMLVKDSEVVDEKPSGPVVFVKAARFAKQYEDAQGPRLCPDEPFANDPAVEWACTAFWIPGNVLVTALHCVTDAGGVEHLRALNKISEFDDKHLVIARGDLLQVKLGNNGGQIGGPGDWAFLLPKGGSGVPLGTSDDVLSTGEPVYMMGYPDGLSEKYTGSPSILADQLDGTTLYHVPIDGYGGNSGSPVFRSSDGMVVGIYIGGSEDFEPDTSCAPGKPKLCNCDRAKKCTLGAPGCAGELVIPFARTHDH